MSKKNIRRTTKGLSPKPVVKQDDTVFIVREDLDEEQEGLKTATAGGAGGLNAPALRPAAEQPAVPSKPLAPLATMWPNSVPPTGGTKPLPAPAPQVQTVAQSPTAPEKAVVVAQVPKRTAPRVVTVSFALLKPNAKRVSVCGEFNGWSPSATPLKRHNDGHWETTVALERVNK